MFAQIAYSVQILHYKWAVWVATDTDVIMMCMYYITQIYGLQKQWVKSMNIFQPDYVIREALAGKYDVAASELTTLILSTYILTGCDTVSYLFRRGKRRAHTTVIKTPDRSSATVQVR